MLTRDALVGLLGSNMGVKIKTVYYQGVQKIPVTLWTPGASMIIDHQADHIRIKDQNNGSGASVWTTSAIAGVCGVIVEAQGLNPMNSGNQMVYGGSTSAPSAQGSPDQPWAFHSEFVWARRLLIAGKYSAASKYVGVKGVPAQFNEVRIYGIWVLLEVLD